MRDHISLFVKPVYEEKYKLIGWTWEVLTNGRCVRYGETVEPTISLARAAGQLFINGGGEDGADNTAT